MKRVCKIQGVRKRMFCYFYKLLILCILDAVSSFTTIVTNTTAHIYSAIFLLFCLVFAFLSLWIVLTPKIFMGIDAEQKSKIKAARHILTLSQLLGLACASNYDNCKAVCLSEATAFTSSKLLLFIYNWRNAFFTYHNHKTQNTHHIMLCHKNFTGRIVKKNFNWHKEANSLNFTLMTVLLSIAAVAQTVKW